MTSQMAARSIIAHQPGGRNEERDQRNNTKRKGPPVAVRVLLRKTKLTIEDMCLMELASLTSSCLGSKRLNHKLARYQRTFIR